MRKEAIGKIPARQPDLEAGRGDIRMTPTALRAGSAFVLDANFEDDRLSIVIDGLKRVDGPSTLGDFHYVPMLFHDGRTVCKEQRLLLEFYGLFLFEIQGTFPTYGEVWHGRACKTTRVQLKAMMRKADQFLQEAKQMASSGSPPSLILNNHCQLCEFRRRCHDQAVQEDNLSLLRGMGEKELKSYMRKGIFTVTQLSYTFRPRRRPKWARAAPRPHSFCFAKLWLYVKTKSTSMALPI